METRSAKRRKLVDSSAGSPKTDRISHLPDDVIHLILGLLPLKTIAATSVLSRRWAQIWHSFPDLDFTTVTSDNRLPTKSNRLRFHRTYTGLLLLCDRHGDNFISKVLSSRHKNSDLRALRFSAYVSLTCLNNLIRRALRFNVTELTVEFATDGVFNMPKRVISNGSVRILRLRSWSPGFRLPSIAALRSGSRFLQELSLTRVVLDKQPSLTDVFTDASFPALKKLSISVCSRLKRINIRCSGLREVTLQDCEQLEQLEVDGAWLEELRVANCFHEKVEESSVEVHAPRLRVVEWVSNGVTGKTLFRNLTAMEVASVGCYMTHRKREAMSAVVFRSTTSFLQGICNVRRLKLEDQCIEILEDRNFGTTLSPFNNLEFLELRVYITRSTRRALSLLFRSCPSLHTFVFSVYDYNYYERKRVTKDLWRTTSLEDQYWETQRHAMKPFLEHLKVVKIHGFGEYEDEVSLVKFLLKYGQALEEMTVSKLYDRSSPQQFKSQLMACTRASSNAKIYFIPI